MDCRAGSTRQRNEFKKTCAVGNCQAPLAVAQFNRQEKQLHNCTAILCSCPNSLPLFPQHPAQAKSAKHASAHEPNAQQGWVKLSRAFYQGKQGHQTQLLAHMVRTYTMCMGRFDRKRMPPAMCVTNAWPCTSAVLRIRDAGLSNRRVCGWAGGWLGGRGGGGGGGGGRGPKHILNETVLVKSCPTSRAIALVFLRTAAQDQPGSKHNLRKHVP